MNAEIKTQWLEALRSGKYAQGQYALRQSTDGQTTHCCLGVLCEIAVGSGVVVANDEVVDEDSALIQTVFDDNVAFLPESVQVWAGIKDASGSFEPQDDDHYRTLTGLNDNEHSFDEIAGVIERYF